VPKPQLPQISARQLRLASGIVLLSYLAMHLCTHMTGLVSLTLAERCLQWSIRIWQSAAGTAALYGAFALHLVLALRTIATRAHWQLPLIEWVRLWAGFSLPLLLIGHVVATRVAVSAYGFEPTYGKVVPSLVAGGTHAWQIALLAPGWVHGCLGIWLSLRHWPAAQRLRPVLLAVLVAVPLLSAAGFMQMSRDLAAAGVVAIPRGVDPTRPLALGTWKDWLLGGYCVLLAAALLWGRWRAMRQRARRAGAS